MINVLQTKAELLRLTLVIFIFPLSLLLSGCESKLVYDPKEHLPFQQKGDANITIFANIQGSKTPVQAGLYPATKYFEGNAGISGPYDSYIVDSTYTSLVRISPVTDGKSNFSSIPPGSYYAIAWFTKEERRAVDLPAARGGLLASDELAQLVEQHGSVTVNGRKYTQADVVYEPVLRNYGLAKKIDVLPASHINVYLDKILLSHSVSTPSAGFLWKQQKIYGIKVIRSPMEKGADFNAKKTDTGTTALLKAAENGQIEVVKLLLENGADVNAKSSSGSTALWMAAKNNDVEVIKLLLKKGADINAKATDGGTPLMIAAQQGYMEVVKFLLENGADVNAKNVDGVEALWQAAWKGHLEVAKILLENGANVNAKRTTDGATALWISSINGHVEVVKFLLENGANVNAKNTDGATALLRTAQEGQADVVKVLLTKGADINAKNKDGETALEQAAWLGHTDIVQILKKAGAKE